MSKYIKLEDAIEKCKTIAGAGYKWLSDLPTIEVSEDCISRGWLISFIDAGHLRNPNELCYSENGVVELIKNAPSVVPSRAEGEWKWETNDICHNCGYEIPHLERIVGETVLMDSKDWQYCPNCGNRKCV